MSLSGIVGRIVGPILERAAGGIGNIFFQPTDFPYDYAIGGLPFLTAPGKEAPYQRATAAFRKEQFDASASVGDQSLTGWWTRGQLSFHTGAGIRFNDAFNDEATANRYWDGVGVNPWTPGQLILSGSWENATRVGNSAYMLGGWDGSDPVVYYISASDSKLYATSSATPISATTTGGFAPDPNKGGTVYYIDGAHIVNPAATYDSQQTDGHNFLGVWWAHGRLFVIDSTGRWYTLAGHGTGSSVAEADAFWDGDGATGPWVVADSPAAVFLARARTIYKVTLDTDGTVPTLSAPAVAAELPDNETVQTMSYYLGFLVIVTDKGVRIGLTDSSGNVQYGPAILEFASSTCRTVAAVGSRVYCTGRRSVDETEQIVTIDLAQPTTDGVFAYTLETPVDWGTDDNTGIAYSDGTLYSYSDTTFQSLGDPAAASTGYLSTGFIRYGTAEKKTFHSLAIKIEGTEGSVSISIVERGDVETLIANLPATPSGDYEINLNRTAPDEYLGIKFTLIAGDNGLSPVLRSYQLRALPAPAARTRMIQVPLECWDYETAPGGNVTGFTGWAWQRLSALEEMESGAGTVLFQDLRTGETGQAFIEQLSFVNESPGTRNMTGFGGTLMATLRKV